MKNSAEDIRWLSNLALGIYSCREETDLADILTSSIHRHFRSSISQVEEWAFDLSTYVSPILLGNITLPPEYLIAIHDSPIAVETVSTLPQKTMRLSDLASPADLERTLFYNHVMRKLDFCDQLIGTFFGTSGTEWAFGVNRDRLFSDAEKALFECVRCHAKASLLRIRRSNVAIDLINRPEVRLRPNLTPQSIPQSVQKVLPFYFPESRREIRSGDLPANLRDWVASSLRLLSGEPPYPLTYFRIEGPRGFLIVRLFPGQEDGNILLRFTEELRRPNTLDLQSKGLTGRECEVIHWLIRGKGDNEIGIILGSSGRTISKHVENILRKTGTTTRGAATAIANAWMAERTSVPGSL